MLIPTALTHQNFTPEALEGEEIIPRFKIRSLNGEENTAVIMELQANQITAKGISLALSAGLIGWEGVSDINGVLDFKASLIPFLPAGVRIALATKIIELSNMTEDQEKN